VRAIGRARPAVRRAWFRPSAEAVSSVTSFVAQCHRPDRFVPPATQHSPPGGWPRLPLGSPVNVVRGCQQGHVIECKFRLCPVNWAISIAPRPLSLQTGDQDFWSDPKGEFLAATAAGAVYKLLGKEGLDTNQWPSAGTPFSIPLATTCTPADTEPSPRIWDIYLKFLRMSL
jgi:hypothetical protein